MNTIRSDELHASLTNCERSAFFIGALFTWLFLLHFSTNLPYWRDSGEFLITATFLDVSHPAGSPLYSQIANLFTLIPFGALTWRVNLFSAFAAAALVLLSMRLAYQLSVDQLKASRHNALLAACTVPLTLLGSASFVRQGLTSEVYQLLALSIIGLLLLVQRFYTTRDVRYLVGASFLGGLGAAVHIVLGIVLLPALIIIFFQWRITRRAILPAFFFGLLGIATYAYVPVRAWAQPPLNTGAAWDIKSFWNLISDARDRALKLPVRSNFKSDTAKNVLRATFTSFVAFIPHDLKSFAEELPVISLLLGLTAIVLLARTHAVLAAFFCSAFFPLWIFFHGWNPDPWVPLLSLIALLQAVLIAVALTRLCSRKKGVSAVAAIGIFVLLLGHLAFSDGVKEAGALSQYASPRDEVRRTVGTLPSHAVLVLERDWFLAKWQSLVDGFRPDVVLVYQPRLLFPRYFEPFGIIQRGEGGGSFVVRRERDPYQASDREADFHHLKRLISFVTATSTLFVEPNVTINEPLSRIARLRSDGLLAIDRGSSAAFDPNLFTIEGANLASLSIHASRLPAVLRSDALEHLYEGLTNTGDFLIKLQAPEGAISLYQAVCGPIVGPRCSETTWNNLGVYLFNVKRYEEAADIFSALAVENPSLDAGKKAALAHAAKNGHMTASRLPIEEATPGTTR